MVRGLLQLAVVGQGQVGGVGHVQRDPAVGTRQAAVPGPEHLTRRSQLVEHRGLVVGDPGGQHQRLQRRGGYGAPGKLLDHGDHAVDPAERDRRRSARRAGSAPVRPARPAPPRGAAGQRAPSQGAQHLGVTPLRARSRGPELALQHAPLGGEPGQRLVAHGDAQAEPLGHLGGGERPVRAGVAADQVAQRVLDRLGEDVRHSRRHRDAEAVAQPGDVLDDGPALLAGHQHRHHAPGVDQHLDPVGHLVRRRCSEPGSPRWTAAPACAAGRRCPRCREPAGPRRAAGARTRPRRAPPGRAARAARPGRGARRAVPGRGSARRRGARRWGSRPRT